MTILRRAGMVKAQLCLFHQMRNGRGGAVLRGDLFVVVLSINTLLLGESGQVWP